MKNFLGMFSLTEITNSDLNSADENDDGENGNSLFHLQAVQLFVHKFVQF